MKLAQIVANTIKVLQALDVYKSPEPALSHQFDLVRNRIELVHQFLMDTIPRLRAPRPVIYFLWKDKDGNPRMDFRSPGPNQQSPITLPVQFDWVVPAGMWIVAVDCSLRRVIVGVTAQSDGTGDGRIAITRDTVEMGNLVRLDIDL